MELKAPESAAIEGDRVEVAVQEGETPWTVTAKAVPASQGRVGQHWPGTDRSQYGTGWPQVAGVRAAVLARDRPKPVWHGQAQRPDRTEAGFWARVGGEAITPAVSTPTVSRGRPPATRRESTAHPEGGEGSGGGEYRQWGGQTHSQGYEVQQRRQL